MSDYALSIAGWENEEMRYPDDKPYALRDQGVRRYDETIKVVLWDAFDVLSEMSDVFSRLAGKAKELALEAEALNEDDEDYTEYLMDILQQAEQLDHVSIEWDGDAGMVHTSISDYWYTVEDASDD